MSTTARAQKVDIAAAAELSQRTVLHLDKDFDLIAELTVQPMDRVQVQ